MGPCQTAAKGDRRTVSADRHRRRTEGERSGKGCIFTSRQGRDESRETCLRSDVVPNAREGLDRDVGVTCIEGNEGTGGRDLIRTPEHGHGPTEEIRSESTEKEGLRGVETETPSRIGDTRRPGTVTVPTGLSNPHDHDTCKVGELTLRPRRGVTVHSVDSRGPNRRRVDPKLGTRDIEVWYTGLVTRQGSSVSQHKPSPTPL